MRMDQLYQEIILDHYRDPKGRGLREPFDAEAHHVNPTCGDEVTVRVKVSDGVIDDVSYVGIGCSISQAAASVMHELVRGRKVADALAITDAFTEVMTSRGEVEPDEEVLGDGIAFAGVARYPARVKCALLAWMAFKDALLRAGGDGTAPDAGRAKEML
jgi:nitrogen fixation protein NifU and related proteins